MLFISKVVSFIQKLEGFSNVIRVSLTNSSKTVSDVYLRR